MNWTNIIFWMASIFVLTGCDSKKFNPKPLAMGEPNRITVVADQSEVKGPLGDTLRALFEKSYLITPQDEPQYDLRYHTPNAVAADEYKRSLRTYIIPVITKDTSRSSVRFVKNFVDRHIVDKARIDTSITNRIYKNLWAKGQIIILVLGKDEKQLISRIKDQYPSIINLIRPHDQKLIHSRAFVEGEDRRLTELIDSMFGLKLEVPEGYYMAVKKKNTLWLRKDYLDINMNIMIAQYRYKNANQVTKEGMVSMFNDLGKLVTTDTPDDRVVIDDKNFPVVLYTKTVDGHYAVEMRAIWNTVKDFFGGPAIALAIIDTTKGKLYYITGFVYSPSKQKRDLIEQLGHIISSVQLKR